MKYFIAFLISFSAAASENCSVKEFQDEVKETLEIKTDVPNHLKGATIIVRTADGRESSVPAEKFKVVPRKQQFIVTRTEKSKELSCTANTSRTHRVALLGGHGTQSGLKTSQSGSTVEVESKVGFVGGLQYQHMVSDRFSLGVQGQTNKSGSLLLGVDF